MMTRPETDLLADFRAARSLPLAWLRSFVDGRHLTIVGALSSELAMSLGSPSRVFPSALAGAGTGRLPYWSGHEGRAIDPGSLYETDVLVVADLGWVRQLLTDPFATQAAAATVNDDLVLPVILSPYSGLMIVSWYGFSEATTQEGRLCRWCIAENGEAYVTIRRAAFAPRSVRFHFSLSPSDQLRVAVRDGTGAITATGFTTIDLDLPVGDTMVTFHAVEPEASSGIREPQEPRPGHFALCSPWLESHDGSPVLGDRAFVDSALPDDDHLTDIHFRTRLHSAGFPYVGGIVRSTNGGAIRPVPWTRGDIFNPEPLHPKTGQVYTGMTILPSDVVWYVASMNATRA